MRLSFSVSLKKLPQDSLYCSMAVFLSGFFQPDLFPSDLFRSELFSGQKVSVLLQPFLLLRLDLREHGEHRFLTLAVQSARHIVPRALHDKR